MKVININKLVIVKKQGNKETIFEISWTINKIVNTINNCLLNKVIHSIVYQIQVDLKLEENLNFLVVWL